MFQVIVMWNLAKPEQELSEVINEVELRGYNEETFITGEFAWKIAENKIKPLSVSDIADKHCPTRRDLYIKKGVSRPSERIRRGETTWGIKAGILVEEYLQKIVENVLKIADINSDYSKIIEISDTNHSSYVSGKQHEINRLEKLEKRYPEETGNTGWLKKLLKSNGRAEFAFNYLNEVLKENTSINGGDIFIGKNAKIDKPKARKKHVKQIGINLPATPDFIMPKYGIVGDIKTGIEFKSHFQLTCAGYALAYENVNGEGHNINWGVIYFFPTRNPSLFRKSITFAQVYIFPIDNYLRKEFLTKRDEAYNIISKSEFPKFPPKSEREHCRYCRFRDFCIKNGLDLEVEKCE
jgi:CRISPR/Cas system-associated exonuclease Cas4 (RecB family)